MNLISTLLISLAVIFTQPLHLVNDSPEEHYKEGLVLMEERMYLEAIGAFTYAISLDSGFAAAYFERGKAKKLLLGQNTDGYVASMEDFVVAIKFGEKDAIAEVYDTGHNICYSLDINSTYESTVYCLDFSNLQLAENCGIHQKINDVLVANFWNNELKNMAEIIELLPNLISLDLGKNNLSALPDQISQLKNLYGLNLSHNDVSLLPASLNQLPHLKNLNLRNNQIIDLKAIEGNNTIEILDLSLNKLKELPKAVYSLGALKELDISGNEIPYEDIAAIEASLPTVSIIY